MNTPPRIAFVTTLQPETHYSRYLIGALEERLQSRASVLVYADKDPRNKALAFKSVEPVWTPSFLFPVQIVGRALKDRPALVHLQHEINMYGGPSTAILFPVLLLLLRVARMKTVVTVHSVVSTDEIDEEFMRTFSWRPSWILVRAVRLFFSILYRSIGWLAARVIVHSQYMARLLERDYRVPARKIVSIPIGVPAANPRAGSQSEYAGAWAAPLSGKKLVLYFGYIIRRKGLEYLIEAFQSLVPDFPDHALVLAGGELDYQSDYARNLRLDVKARGLDGSIVFTSFIPAAEIENLFAASEFVVLPYAYSISSSLPLSFAMEYGKPVIATRLGTLEEEIDDGRTGFLVAPRDAAALARAMRQLMSDESLRCRLGEGAREKGRQRSWLTVAEQTMQVYRSVESRLAV